MKAACLYSEGGNDAPGAHQVVLPQVVQGLVQDDSTGLEPHGFLEFDALELLQVLHKSAISKGWHACSVKVARSFMTAMLCLCDSI